MHGPKSIYDEGMKLFIHKSVICIIYENIFVHTTVQS